MNPFLKLTAAASARFSESRMLRRLQLVRSERGAATAEYSIVIMAAVAFAGLLVVIMRSDEVRAILTNLVQSALTSGG